MDPKTQHTLGITLVLGVLVMIGYHFYAARTATPVNGDYMPYYGPPAGIQATLAQENPDVLQVLPSAPSGSTGRDHWGPRARIYDATAPVLQVM